MKLTIIGNNWFPSHPGGLDRYVYELIHHLIPLGTDVNLYGLDLPSSAPGQSLHLRPLASKADSFFTRLYSAYQALDHLPKSCPEAINLHFALYGFTALPHLPRNVPVVCTFHGPWALESQQEGDSLWGVWLKHQLEAFVYRRCDRFIVLSKAFGHILNQDYGIPWDAIRVIPGGVDTQRFCPHLSRRQARDLLGWPNDRFILFTPRRLVSRMGLDKLINAIAQLQEKNDLWLAIAGKGPLRDALEAQVTALNLSHSVHFLGFLPDEQLPLAYQAADLTIMPSQSLEGFGLVLLESLASGTPVLCTPIGGMPEVITDFSPNLITASPSESDLAVTLRDILTGHLSLPNRHDCRDYASTHFNWTTIAQRVKQVFQE
ncbi:MAG: glycosyltransferase family 4 protein [Symploca sp. SIO3C6]|nr:glycosyltransferase family 4 protein [Symploca sp. SIO3C6]